MQTKYDYRFSTSVSVDAYINKEISGAMIGSTKEEKNRIIRKEYGYPANKGIGYKEESLTPSELLDKLINGHVFCHLFNPTSIRKDGTFGSSEKKDDNFKGSYCVGVDIDETQYNNISDYISALKFKPTFYYSSYSNKTGKPKFRMVYIFSELIENKYFFRYVAWKINKQIENDTNEIISDDCNLRCSQYFNGTNKNNDELNVEYGLSNVIYDFSDFNIETNDYISFLKNDCFYKSKSKIRNKDINNILSVITSNSSTSTTTYYNDLQKCGHPIIDENETIISENSGDTVSNELEYDKSLVNDMSRLDYDEFMKYNRHKYNYFYRVEKDEWIDGLYQFIDNNFFSLYYNVSIVKDGSKRRKKVFERMCLRRVINPNVDINTIIYNAYEDIHRYFDNSDNLLNIDYIIKNAVRAFEFSIPEIKEMYSDNIAYLQSKAPKSGIILKRNIGKLADRNTYLKDIRYNIIDDYYNINCTVSENLSYINEYVFSISEKTLYNYCKDRNIDTKINKDRNDSEIMSLYDFSLSIRKNVERFKEMGISISKSKLSNLIKEYNNNISISPNNVSYSVSSTTYYNDLQFCGQSISEENQSIKYEFSDLEGDLDNNDSYSLNYQEIEKEGLRLFNHHYNNYNNYYY